MHRAALQFISKHLTCRLPLLIAFSCSLIPFDLVHAGMDRSAPAPQVGRPLDPNQGAQEAAVLEPGKPIARELSGGQEHRYQLTLAEGQYASLMVEQHGVDVGVRLFGTEGQFIAVVDSEYRSQGQERVELVAEAAGSYRLGVAASSKSAPAGSYEIRLAELRAATSNDRSLQEARRLETNFDRSFSAGKYEDARQSAERALAVSENVLGTEHPFVATLLYDLALYCDEKQDFARAISLTERALATGANTLGDEHPQTINLSRSFAWLLYETNEVAKAERLAERAVELSQKTLGPEHHSLAHCLMTLGNVTRDPKRSEQLLQRALMMVEKTLGAEHDLTGTVLNALGDFYSGEGDYSRAEQLLMRAQAIYEKNKGRKTSLMP
jgi:tetratricopeptide (TPR) repeat protein